MRICVFINYIYQTFLFIQQNPAPFFTLAKELYPGKFKPTPCHYFIKLLAEKGLLQRAYTQVSWFALCVTRLTASFRLPTLFIQSVHLDTHTYPNGTRLVQNAQARLRSLDMYKHPVLMVYENIRQRFIDQKENKTTYPFPTNQIK